MAMLRLRFHASWLPADHEQFWTVIDHSRKIETVSDLLEYFNEQQKSLAEHYQFHLPKRSTKLKYMKAFVNECVLPPHAQALEILRDNDQIDFRLEIDAQEKWLCVESPPSVRVKRKRSVEVETPTATHDLDQRLRTIAEPTGQSPEKSTFNFQFGNKRGRPIPPRPAVISAFKVNSLVPRQVLQTKKLV